MLRGRNPDGQQSMDARGSLDLGRRLPFFFFLLLHAPSQTLNGRTACPDPETFKQDITAKGKTNLRSREGAAAVLSTVPFVLRQR